MSFFDTETSTFNLIIYFLLIIIVIAVIIIILYYSIKYFSQKTVTSTETSTVQTPTVQTPTVKTNNLSNVSQNVPIKLNNYAAIPLSVNMFNLVAWYDPNNIIFNSSNSLTRWNNINTLNSNLDLSNIVGNIKVSKYNYNNLNVVQFINNHSYLNAGKNTALINGFICVIKLSDNNLSSSSDLGMDMLFCPKGNDVDYSFRYPRISRRKQNTTYDTSSLIYLNGKLVFDFNKQPDNSITYDNTDKFVIIYTKFRDIVSINIQISTSFKSRGIVGYVGDFICFSPNHTDNDRIGFEKYLSLKWNIPIKY